MSSVTLPGYYLRQIVELVRPCPVDVERWLVHLGLAGRLDEALVTLEEAELHQLINGAIGLTREPALGLLLGARLQAQTHGTLGYAAMSAGSLRQALELFERFMPLRNNLVTLARRQVGQELQLHFAESRPLGEIRRPVLEATMVAISNLLAFITQGGCQLRYVAFPFAADASQSLAAELFRCPLSYGEDWAGLALSLDGLDQPLRLADPATFEDAARICEQELNRLNSASSLAARVRRLLLEKQSDFPSLQLTARLFHMTPRTLHRRLEDEGTSFRQLQEEVRHALAVEYLRSGRLSIQEIAYALGYTEIANFRRAFKRWEALPPSQFLAQRGKDGD